MAAEFGLNSITALKMDATKALLPQNSSQTFPCLDATPPETPSSKAITSVTSSSPATAQSRQAWMGLDPREPEGSPVAAEGNPEEVTDHLDDVSASVKGSLTKSLLGPFSGLSGKQPNEKEARRQARRLKAMLVRGLLPPLLPTEGAPHSRCEDHKRYKTFEHASEALQNLFGLRHKFGGNN